MRQPLLKSEGNKWARPVAVGFLLTLVLCGTMAFMDHRDHQRLVALEAQVGSLVEEKVGVCGADCACFTKRSANQHAIEIGTQRRRLPVGDPVKLGFYGLGRPNEADAKAMGLTRTEADGKPPVYTIADETIWAAKVAAKKGATAAADDGRPSGIRHTGAGASSGSAAAGMGAARSSAATIKIVVDNVKLADVTATGGTNCGSPWAQAAQQVLALPGMNAINAYCVNVIQTGTAAGPSAAATVTFTAAHYAATIKPYMQAQATINPDTIRAADAAFAAGPGTVTFQMEAHITTDGHPHLSLTMTSV